MSAEDAVCLSRAGLEVLRTLKALDARLDAIANRVQDSLKWDQIQDFL
jgi:hypothetical protein